MTPSVDTRGLTGASREAAALRAELERIGSTNVNAQVTQSFTSISRGADGARTSIDQTGDSINQLTGRLSLLADAALILGPGLVPIAATGAVSIGALAVAATGLAVAGGAAIVAFQGVGDAVEAVGEYHLDPTVENLEAAREAMSQLGPDARTFVTEFQKIRPALTAIRDAAAAGLFPGLTDSLDVLDRLGPKLEEIAFAAGDASGFAVNSAAESLVSDRWQPFLDVLAQEVPEAVGSISRVIGDVAHGMSEMLRVFAGDNGFLGWIEDVAAGFDSWASSAEAESSLEGIMTYVRQNGPDLQQLVTTLTQALGAIVEAAAPLGGPVLVGLTAVAEAVRVIAESDMATPLLAALAALRLFNRAQAVTMAASARMTSMRATPAVPPPPNAAAAALLAGMPAAAAGAHPSVVRAQQAERRRMMAGAGAGAGAMALLATGTAEEMGATNAAMGAMIGSMMGPWGVAVGVAGGGFMDIIANARQTEEALNSFNNVLSSGTTNFADYGTAAADLRKKQEDYYANFEDAGTATQFLLTNPAETYNLIGDALDGNVERFGQYANAAGEAEAKTTQMGRNFLWVAREMGDKSIKPSDWIAPDAEKVQKILDDLGPSLAKLGLSPEDVAGLSGDALSAFVADLQGLNGELFNSQNLFRGFVASMAAADKFLSKRSGVRAYEEALDAANKALKENGRTLDANRSKGRANAAALDAIAASGLKVAETMKGQKRNEFLRGLRADLMQAGRAFGQNRNQMANFLDGVNLVDAGVFKLRQQFNKLPRNVKTIIREEGAIPSKQRAMELIDKLNLVGQPRKALLQLVAEGEGDVAAAKALIESVRSRSATVTITTQHVVRGRPILGNADGGTIPKTGLGYADRHLRLLADGEEVISNRYGQADRHRLLLKAINANQMANGGTVMSNRTAERHSMHQSGVGGTVHHHHHHGTQGNLTGVLRTPWGPAEVEVIASNVARREMDAERKFEGAHR